MQLGLAVLFFISLFSKADYQTVQAFEQEKSPLKALVFLSEICPCSKSHIKHLNDLTKKYPHLKIYGVVSEPPVTPEREKIVDEYFKNSGFEFPIIQDKSQNLVKKYGALKTPHLTLFQKNESKNTYDIIYEGGVSNQKDFEKSTVKYFAENLEALSRGEKVAHKNGPSLGCYIRRL